MTYNFRKREEINTPQRFEDEGEGLPRRCVSYEEPEIDQEVYARTTKSSRSRKYRGPITLFNPHLPPAAFPTLDGQSYARSQNNKPDDDLSSSCPDMETINKNAPHKSKMEEPPWNSRSEQNPRSSVLTASHPSIMVAPRLHKKSTKEWAEWRPQHDGTEGSVMADNMRRLEAVSRTSLTSFDLNMMEMESSEDDNERPEEVSKGLPKWDDLSMAHKLQLFDLVSERYDNGPRKLGLLEQTEELKKLILNRNERLQREDEELERHRNDIHQRFLRGARVTQERFRRSLEENVFQHVSEDDGNTSIESEIEKAKAYLVHYGISPSLLHGVWVSIPKADAIALGHVRRVDLEATIPGENSYTDSTTDAVVGSIEPNVIVAPIANRTGGGPRGRRRSTERISPGDENSDEWLPEKRRASGRAPVARTVTLSPNRQCRASGNEGQHGQNRESCPVPQPYLRQPSFEGRWRNRQHCTLPDGSPSTGINGSATRRPRAGNFVHPLQAFTRLVEVDEQRAALDQQVAQALASRSVTPPVPKARLVEIEKRRGMLERQVTQARNAPPQTTRNTPPPAPTAQQLPTAPDTPTSHKHRLSGGSETSFLSIERAPGARQPKLTEKVAEAEAAALATTPLANIKKRTLGDSTKKNAAPASVPPQAVKKPASPRKRTSRGTKKQIPTPTDLRYEAVKSKKRPSGGADKGKTPQTLDTSSDPLQAQDLMTPNKKTHQKQGPMSITGGSGGSKVIARARNVTPRKATANKVASQQKNPTPQAKAT